MSMVREQVVDATRRQRIADLKEGGALILERDAFWWEIEFERGGEICIHVISADVDDDTYEEHDFAYYPASRTLALVNKDGVFQIITGVVTLRQDWGARKQENWTVDLGYIHSRYIGDDREKKA